MTASIWHRPAVTEQEKDRLAERQARAAVALIRLGRGETVWNRLQHNKDPRLRSFIINWFSLLGGEARTSLPRLKRPTHRVGRGRVSRPAGKIDDRLFDRRHIHPPGTNPGSGQVPHGQAAADRREHADRQTARAIYRDDPDAGIHGAAEWTLRRWRLVKLGPLGSNPDSARRPGRG